MPNFETQPRKLEGKGPPLVDEGNIGDRYTDLDDNGRVWVKRKTGWNYLGKLFIMPTLEQKRAWNKAAAEAKQSLNDWVCEKLDAAAEESESAFESLQVPIADLKEGDWFVDAGRSWQIVEAGDPYAQLRDGYGQTGSVHIGRLVTQGKLIEP